MARLESALKRLAEGCFICEMRYPDEFDVLQDPLERQRADDWLSAIGYRLARLGEDGAYFMAHAIVTAEMRSKLREEMRSVRDKLEPMVGFLETLRQAQGHNPQIHAGDMLWESEISEAVRTNSLLERRLIDMREISGLRMTDSITDRVRRMLDQMEDEGYLIETNPNSNGYRVTGKIDYLYQLIAFIAANTTHLSDDDVVDQIEQQSRLEGGGGAGVTVQPPGRRHPSPQEGGDIVQPDNRVGEGDAA